MGQPANSRCNDDRGQTEPIRHLGSGGTALACCDLTARRGGNGEVQPDQVPHAVSAICCDRRESPFGNHCLAHDGEHVWGLDNDKKRICALEKADARGG